EYEQLHHSRLARIFCRETLEAPLDLNRLNGVGAGRRLSALLEGNANPRAFALLRQLRAQVVDDEMAHRPAAPGEIVRVGAAAPGVDGGATPHERAGSAGAPNAHPAGARDTRRSDGGRRKSCPAPPSPPRRRESASLSLLNTNAPRAGRSDW